MEKSDDWDESGELEELDLGGHVSPGSLFQLSAVTLDTLDSMLASPALAVITVISLILFWTRSLGDTAGH